MGAPSTTLPPELVDGDHRKRKNPAMRPIHGKWIFTHSHDGGRHVVVSGSVMGHIDPAKGDGIRCFSKSDTGHHDFSCLSWLQAPSLLRPQPPLPRDSISSKLHSKYLEFFKYY
ncbi:hypothetical protein TIFTF001_025181 [Ficus carica]|uniref:Uncharacterized protein n=1 Tax=Ficus carica TaxID=3494 RepID=A0AA88DDZ0_FICCA|nr:hypothetical protein TIFTF001_025181 [Ficus carica]